MFLHKNRDNQCNNYPNKIPNSYFGKYLYNRSYKYHYNPYSKNQSSHYRMCLYILYNNLPCTQSRTPLYMMIYNCLYILLYMRNCNLLYR